MPREDVEDELRPVQHRTVQLALKIPMLGRGEVVVEENEVTLGFGRPSLNLPKLAGSQESCRHRSVPDLDAVAEDLRACSRGQLRQFRDGLLRTERSERN